MSSAPSSVPAKAYTRGTHRLVSPAETLESILPKSRAMGITRVANLTGLDVIGLPVVAVVRPNSRSISVAQGKGLDLVAAKVSGLMESIENYHAEHLQKPLVLATLNEIAERGVPLDTQRLPRVEGATLHSDTRLLWIEGHEVLGRTSIWLPFEVVHADYTLPLPTGTGAFMMGDSGIASGNHPLEATTHAVCELIERDAVTLWQFGRESAQASRRVDLRTVEDEACAGVLESFARAGVRVGVWDVTSDVGVAAFLCTIMDESPSAWRPLPPASGSGCHPCKEVALLRALTEAAQVRLTIIAGSRDDLGAATYTRGRDAALVAQTATLLGARAAGKPFDATPSHVADTFASDIAFTLAGLHRAGIEQVAVVDLSSPKFGIPVVRVVVPGLEGIHDAPGYVPGPRVRSRLS